MAKVSSPADNRLGTLDWVVAALAGGEAVGLPMFPVAARAVRSMFDSSGGTPPLTLWVLTGRIPIAFAVVTFTSLVLGLRPRSGLKRRRAYIVAAILLGALGFAVSLVGLSAPVFAAAK